MKNRGKQASSTLALIVMLLGVIFTASCGGSESDDDNGRIGILVTIAPQAEFVERVGGNRVDVTTMVPEGASPHTYEITPSQMKKVADARLYVAVGSGVDFELAWMDTILDQNKKLTVIDCSKGLTLIEMNSENDQDEEVHEITEGHSHQGADPHIWMSVPNAQIMVRNICEGLIEVDEVNRTYYEQNRDTYLDELAQLDVDIREMLSKVTNRVFMVYHPSFGYFAHEYDLTMLSIEKEGKEPTAKRLEQVIDQAKEYEITTVFASPQISQESAKLVADQIGGRVVIIDPLAENYIENLRYLLNEMVSVLQ